MEVSRERVGPQNDTGSDSAKFDVSVSYSEIESLIELALRAPSGDNCQPWRFTWNDNTLAIFL
jgi:nitroreductase